jgi:hypothetical protein
VIRIGIGGLLCKSPSARIGQELSSICGHEHPTSLAADESGDSRTESGRSATGSPRKEPSGRRHETVGAVVRERGGLFSALRNGVAGDRLELLVRSGRKTDPLPASQQVMSRMSSGVAIANDCLNPDGYSSRSASTGAALDARSAGSNDAASTVASDRAPAITSVRGSLGAMP